MRLKSPLLVLITVMLVILIGATSAMAKVRTVQFLLPNCE
jgi:hypothetical protein